MKWFLILCLLAAPAVAQPQPQPQPQEKLKTVADYKKELGLSDKQVGDLNKAIGDYQQSMMAKRMQTQQTQSQFASLSQAHADLGDLKAHLARVCELRTQMRLEDLEVAHRVQKILTAAQLKKWKAIQGQQRP